MKQKKKHTEHVHYIDDEGNRFEMEVIKRFTYEEKTYVLLSERNEHEGQKCCCHHKHHKHHAKKNSGENALYVFESIDDAEGEKLIPVNEETLKKIERLL